jgi:acylphosphatase
VFFRSKTSAEARRQGVTGWVRNLFDGRVEAVFEGEEESVKRLLDFCRTGTAGARISKVDVVRETYTGEFDSLEIKC